MCLLVAKIKVVIQPQHKLSEFEVIGHAHIVGVGNRYGAVGRLMVKIAAVFGEHGVPFVDVLHVPAGSSRQIKGRLVFLTPVLRGVSIQTAFVVVRKPGGQAELIDIKRSVVCYDVTVIAQPDSHSGFVFDILDADEAVNQFKNIE